MNGGKLQSLNSEENLLPNSKATLAELSKGLAHPVRVEIVRMLENKPVGQRCVCGDIVDALPLAQSSVSQHLKVLKETGWIQGEIDGPRVCYCTVDGILEHYKNLLENSIHGNGKNDIPEKGEAHRGLT